MRFVTTLLVIAAWICAAAVALEVARRTTAGPVVLRLTEQHGVHAGDVLAVYAGASVAAVVTLVARRSSGR